MHGRRYYTCVITNCVKESISIGETWGARTELELALFVCRNVSTPLTGLHTETYKLSFMLFTMSKLRVSL